jgi:hypothetical protein
MSETVIAELRLLALTAQLSKQVLVDIFSDCVDWASLSENRRLFFKRLLDRAAARFTEALIDATPDERDTLLEMITTALFLPRAMNDKG